jgi:predicted secreted protein
MLKTIANNSIIKSGLMVFFIQIGTAGAQEAGGVPANMQRLTLSATAVAELPHDWLQIRLGSQREGSDAATVQRLLKSDVDAALNQLRPSAEVGQLQLTSGPLALHPRYGRDGKTNGWQGSAELVVEGRDISRISQSTGSVQNMVIQGLQFSVSQHARANGEEQLQSQAIDRFRAKAQNAAKAFGFSGFQVVQVQLGSTDQGGSTNRPYLAMAAKAMSADQAPIPVEPGRTQVQLTVSGTVQLR